MGGHGGLNILGQKSWNVYGQEQRANVRRDEEEFAARDEEDPDAGSLPKGASGPAPRPAGHVGELPTAHHVTLAGHEGPVLACRFSRGGSYVLTCGKDRTFKLWNPFKGSLIKTYEGHAHEVRDVACAIDNSRLTTCGGTVYGTTGRFDEGWYEIGVQPGFDGGEVTSNHYLCTLYIYIYMFI